MSGIRIGRLFGIDIAIHPSWFIILVLFAFTLATGFFPNSYEWSPASYWIVSVVATLLLFASVLAHELGHSLIARAQGIPVKNITLFLLGGVASIEKEASTPGREAILAGIGPAVSAAIGAASLALYSFTPGPEYVHGILFYLGVANIALAVFNLLPGFPMDGGRVLRAIIWWRSGDFLHATRWATGVGQAVGGAFIGLGLFQLVGGYGLGGIWLAFIGWMLIGASRASLRQVRLERMLVGVSAGGLARRPETWVPPFVTLAAAARSYFADDPERCLPVEAEREGQAYDGLLCRADLEDRPPEDLPNERVRDAMTDASAIPTVDADAPATEAVKLLLSNELGQVAVLQDGELVGFVDEQRARGYVRRRELAGQA